MSREINIAKCSFEFTQEGNTLGTTEDVESLFVEFEYQLPGEEPFIVLKSPSGWSINDRQELGDLLAQCEDFEKSIREGLKNE
jgi:hypothetical protein